MAKPKLLPVLVPGDGDRIETPDPKSLWDRAPSRQELLDWITEKIPDPEDKKKTKGEHHYEILGGTEAEVELFLHYGPGPHPGTGTEQEVHAGGAAAGEHTPYSKDPAAYINATPTSIRVPIEALGHTKSFGERVALARQYMAMAERGEIDRREPLTVKRCEDGTYIVLDGNETARVLEEVGATEAIVEVAPGLPTEAEIAQAKHVTAEEIRAEAEAIEPEISRIMKETEANFDTHLEGYKLRLKELDSIERKLTTDYARESPVAARDSLKDAVRYTFTMAPRNYVDQVALVQEYLEKRGLEFGASKNYWVEGNPYKGLNTYWLTQQGQPIDVQFHTHESYRTKEAIHHLFEEYRTTEDEDRARALFVQMADTFSRVKDPPGVDVIPVRTRYTEPEEVLNERRARKGTIQWTGLLNGRIKVRGLLDEETGAVYAFEDCDPTTGEWATNPALAGPYWGGDIVMDDPELESRRYAKPKAPGK